MSTLNGTVVANSTLTTTPSTVEAYDGSSRGDWEKVLAMIILGLGSFLTGMLPAVISERNRRRFPLAISLLLCFGAGILLATALVHILPEVRQQMSSNWAEISLCGGFFFIYFIDEFIHYFFGEAIQHTHSHHPPVTRRRSGNGIHSYGAIGNENEPLLQEQSSTLRDDNHEHHHDHSHHHASLGASISQHHSHHHCEDEEAIAAVNARICHTNHTEPCDQAMTTGTLGLFVALSLHSAIEGLAIGVQSSASRVLFLLGAVACHKFVMGFCLGLELRSSSSHTSLRSHFIGILVFALGAVCGIGVGMLVIDIPAAWTSSTLSIVQALAGGTLFYVTVCEVIPREKARWHQNPAHKAAGFAQFFAIALGFSIMCVINYFLNDDDS